MGELWWRSWQGCFWRVVRVGVDPAVVRLPACGCLSSSRTSTSPRPAMCTFHKCLADPLIRHLPLHARARFLLRPPLRRPRSPMARIARSHHERKRSLLQYSWRTPLSSRTQSSPFCSGKSSRSWQIDGGCDATGPPGRSYAPPFVAAEECARSLAPHPSIRGVRSLISFREEG